jgi:hypothetical protein
MTIEELEIWKGFDKILPSYVSFPEVLELNVQSFCYRNKEMASLKKIVKSIDESIKKLICSKEFIKLYSNNRVTTSSEFFERQKKLNLHLIALNKIREKRKLELSKLKAVGK